MNLQSLKPAAQLAQRYGVKSILYGKPGSGKTPLITTAPNPVLLVTEPGLLSIRGSTLPTFDAYTPERIAEFFTWFFESKESSKFDTLAIDSGSQLAEIVLVQELNRQKDGRKAYGELSRRCMEWFDKLFFMQNKHVILICKQMQAETGKQVVKENGVFAVEMTYQAQPYFPGNDLNIKVPHRYDEIFYLADAQIPGIAMPQKAIRTKGTAEILARDRSGNLNELEPPNLADIFRKCML